MVKQVYHPKLYSEILKLIGDDDRIKKELIRECLVIRTQSRAGADKTWVNFVMRDGEGVSLSECFVTDSNKLPI